MCSWPYLLTLNLVFGQGVYGNLKYLAWQQKTLSFIVTRIKETTLIYIFTVHLLCVAGSKSVNPRSCSCSIYDLWSWPGSGIKLHNEWGIESPSDRPVQVTRALGESPMSVLCQLPQTILLCCCHETMLLMHKVIFCQSSQFSSANMNEQLILLQISIKWKYLVLNWLVMLWERFRWSGTSAHLLHRTEFDPLAKHTYFIAL